MASASKHVHMFMRPIVTCKFILWGVYFRWNSNSSILYQNISHSYWTNELLRIMFQKLLKVNKHHLWNYMFLMAHFFWQILVCMKVISMMMMLPFQLLIENAIRSVITPKGTSTENLAYYDETRHKKSLFFLFKSKHQNLNGLDVYHLYAA